MCSENIYFASLCSVNIQTQEMEMGHPGPGSRHPDQIRLPSTDASSPSHGSGHRPCQWTYLPKHRPVHSLATTGLGHMSVLMFPRGEGFRAPPDVTW